jgi:tRNA(Ile)-lysidine synthase
VAVSGGADSMALALLARDWVARHDGSLVALVVDHGLRPESAAETVDVVSRLAAVAIDAVCLSWTGAKPKSGVQAAAREARYRLLAAACRERAVLHLLVGHHAEDQAETVELRRRAGSGRAGLAGMAAVRELEGVRLLRPLLAVPRARLEPTVRARGLTWIEDPSNRDVRFARSALRPASEAQTIARLELAVAAGASRAVTERTLARQCAERVTVHPLGFAELRLAADEPLPLDLLARCITVVGGRTWPPRAAALARLVQDLATPGRAATLGGCIVRRSAARLTVAREPALAVEELTLEPGARVRWDGRFVVTLQRAPASLRLRRLATDGRRRLDAVARSVARSLPGAAVGALPSLWDGPNLLWHPLAADQAFPDMAVHAEARFAPPVPLVGAPFPAPNVVSLPRPLIYRAGGASRPSTSGHEAPSASLTRLGR